MATTDWVGYPITTEFGTSPFSFPNLVNVAQPLYGGSRTYAGVTEEEVAAPEEDSATEVEPVGTPVHDDESAPADGEPVVAPVEETPAEEN